MKTAISVPDETFQRAEQQAAELGITRSEFFSRAAQRYLTELEGESITRQMDAALAAEAANGIEDDSNAWAATAGRRLLSASDDDW